MPTISLQPVTTNDLEALAELRVVAMRESLERIGRFDETRARERLRSTFRPDDTQWILDANERVGFYTAYPTPEGLKLDHFYVLPTHQGRGIGAEVLRQIFAEADACGRPISLGALRENPSNRFYLRHGFVKIREETWDNLYVRHPKT